MVDRDEEQILYNNRRGKQPVLERRRGERGSKPYLNEEGNVERDAEGNDEGNEEEEASGSHPSAGQ
uniref:Uncharacterized protein n=1 Tax=Oryza meridionalis TaxID=40149 RepID=A0A0E0CMS1_9ORYZ